MSFEQADRPSNALIVANLALFGMLASIDKFGLPSAWNDLSETEAQRADRAKSVTALISEVYAVAVKHLGKKRAQDAWKQAAKGQVGRPKGKRSPRSDLILLTVYDSVASTASEKHKKSMPREVANYFKDQQPGLFPN